MWISTVSTTFRLKKEKIKRFQLVAATGFVYDSFMDSKASFCNLFFCIMKTNIQNIHVYQRFMVHFPFIYTLSIVQSENRLSS